MWTKTFELKARVEFTNSSRIPRFSWNFSLSIAALAFLKHTTLPINIFSSPTVSFLCRISINVTNTYMLYYFWRLHISLLSSDRFTLRSTTRKFLLMRIFCWYFKASHRSLVAEWVQCLFVWGCVGLFCFQNKDPVSLSPSCIEQGLSD